MGGCFGPLGQAAPCDADMYMHSEGDGLAAVGASQVAMELSANGAAQTECGEED